MSRHVFAGTQPPPRGLVSRLASPVAAPRCPAPHWGRGDPFPHRQLGTRPGEGSAGLTSITRSVAVGVALGWAGDFSNRGEGCCSGRRKHGSRGGRPWPSRLSSSPRPPLPRAVSLHVRGCTCLLGAAARFCPASEPGSEPSPRGLVPIRAVSVALQSQTGLACLLLSRLRPQHAVPARGGTGRYPG